MNHVDNSLASDCIPMCFSKMQEKVYAEQYPSWTSFVVRQLLKVLRSFFNQFVSNVYVIYLRRTSRAFVTMQ